MKATRIVVACAAAVLIPGCLSAGDRNAQRYYVLEVAGTPVPRAKATRSSTLLVAPPTTSAFYDTQDIVYSRSPGTRAYYQYHAWTERPGRTIGNLLAARLERGGAFRTVAQSTGGVQGDLLLVVHLSEFYHDAAAEPGSALISLTAELVDPARRALVARRSFDRSTPAPSYDAAGAAQAFNRGLAAILDDVSAWVEEAAPR